MMIDVFIHINPWKYKEALRKKTLADAYALPLIEAPAVKAS
jgi:hypothetical protein